METLSEKLNFTTNESVVPERAVKIDSGMDTNIYETLCLYCADNDVDLTGVSCSDFSEASETIFGYGTSDIASNSFYFWIDKE